MIRSAWEMKLTAFMLAASVALAQPHVTNAQMETRAVSGSLDSTFRAIVNQQAAPLARDCSQRQLKLRPAIAPQTV